MKVTKRSGLLEDLDISKIKKVVGFAVKGTDCSQVELESKFDLILKDKIATSDIQSNLIYHANTLVSAEEPDWVIVSGRLRIMDIWSENEEYMKMPFAEFCRHQVEAGRYDSTIIEKYSPQQLNYLGSIIDHELDLDMHFSAVNTCEAKYLMEGEVPQFMFMTIAAMIASVEEDPEERVRRAVKVYEKISSRKISLATPWLVSLRRPGGNLSSCFIVKTDDDIDSLFDNFKNIGLISKFGGGVGFNMSRVRSSGSWVSGSPDSAGGPVPWIKIVNSTAVAVDQLGKRKGAVTVSIDSWHPNIWDFLEMQTENGDQRTKSYDIFPQVVVSDEFMRRVDEERPWILFDPYEAREFHGVELADLYGEEFEEAYYKLEALHYDGKLKLSREVPNARDLFKQMMRTMISTGMPYIAFKDAINEANPNKHEGMIPCVNLCTESFSNVVADKYAHTCNLASVVMGRIESDEDLAETAEVLVYILDNGIALTNPPIKESVDHNIRYRTIGAGMMGLHDYLAGQYMTYHSGLDEISRVWEIYQYHLVKASVELAKTRGAYPAFEGSRWHTGEQFDNWIEKSTTDLDWEGLRDMCKVYGIRNSQLSSPAPNTTTSLFMSATASVLPVYQAIFYEDNSDGIVPVVPLNLKTNPLGYKEYRYYDMSFMNEVISRIQDWVDTGVSYEIIYDHNRDDLCIEHNGAQVFNSSIMYHDLMDAWRKRLKAIYYTRTIKRGSEEAKKVESCAGCAG